MYIYTSRAFYKCTYTSTAFYTCTYYIYTSKALYTSTYTPVQLCIHTNKITPIQLSMQKQWTYLTWTQCVFYFVLYSIVSNKVSKTMSLAAKDQFESLVTTAFASPHPVHYALWNTLAIMILQLLDFTWRLGFYNIWKHWWQVGHTFAARWCRLLCFDMFLLDFCCVLRCKSKSTSSLITPLPLVAADCRQKASFAAQGCRKLQKTQNKFQRVFFCRF